jgi:tyrosyl-DNA phosphodiesterase 2
MVNFQAIHDIIQSKRKTSLPWKRDKPVSQPYFVYDTSTQKWGPVAAPSNTRAGTGSGSAETPDAQIINFLSWNIDFMRPHPIPRMRAALVHLQTITAASPHPSVIFLNEMLESDLTLIQETPWVREGHYLTDLDATYWESGHYGTAILVPKTLGVAAVFRVHYAATRMARDALFVDMQLDATTKLRLCTTHLESLIANPPLRPTQIAVAARYLVDGKAELAGGIVGGDFNAIQPFDAQLHADNGLRDAYLETGGEEGGEAGFTWGQMVATAQREMFGCSRMDKLFFGGDRVEVLDFQRFGLDVVVGDHEIERVLREDEGLDAGWVTDHAGVWGTFRVRPVS